jgi:hypothetical protein
MDSGIRIEIVSENCEENKIRESVWRKAKTVQIAQTM